MALFFNLLNVFDENAKALNIWIETRPDEVLQKGARKLAGVLENTFYKEVGDDFL